MLKDKFSLVTYLDIDIDIYIYIYIYIYILQIEPKLKEIFAERPILAFRRNKRLRDIIGGSKVFDNKKISNVKKFNKGKWQPCFTRSINLCCKQLKPCLIFQSASKQTYF